MNQTSDVDAVRDRLEINDLLVNYCTLVDRSDIDTLVAEVFSEDAVDNHGLGIWSGRQGLHDGFTRVMSQFAGTVHQITNLAIQLDGDRATSRAYVTAWHWLPHPSEERRPAGPSADFVVVGAYDDEIERRPEGWRIVHRTFRQVGGSVVGVGALPEFMIPRRPDRDQ